MCELNNDGVYQAKNWNKYLCTSYIVWETVREQTLKVKLNPSLLIPPINIWRLISSVNIGHQYVEFSKSYISIQSFFQHLVDLQINGLRLHFLIVWPVIISSNNFLVVYLNISKHTKAPWTRKTICNRLCHFPFQKSQMLFQ